jgi:gliding motility-associated lipoprotein GldD
MYPHVNYPNRNYITFDTAFCDFTFSYPDYLHFIKDSTSIDESQTHECWFNLYNDELKSSWHCSYYVVNNRKGFDKLVSDAFTLTDKHNVKANSRRESQINNEYGVAGLLFEVDGPVASPIQFYLTDSTHHFFRASLYLNATVNPDSTAPIFQYLRGDMEKIIESFKWKK